ncbi:hypothetical protein EZY14_003950 [Kordia sp. TARA_039_SRF]|jgi:hypothetical protein|nr:hypothetical protein EZY14_003950 [Kordia sp. TARA_039_SRF]
MKKRKLKNLQLNKKSISNLEMHTAKGGYESNNGSCFWQDCPSSEPEPYASDCYCPYNGNGGGNTNNCQTQVNCGSTGSCYWEDCEG